MSKINITNANRLLNYSFLANEKITRWLSLGAVAGPVLITLAWIILGLMRPETRNEWGVSGGITGMVTQPFSGLGLGPKGSLFNLAFLLNGLLVMVGVFGVFQTIGSGERPALYKASAVMLALSGIGSMICAIFTLNYFFPHMIGFILAVGSPIPGFLTTGIFLRGLPRWRKLGTWLLAASPLTLLFLAFFFFTFQYDLMSAGLGVAGLTERILVLEVQAWYITLGWLAFRHPKEISPVAY
jgi:hypothetical membrane protein